MLNVMHWFRNLVVIVIATVFPFTTFAQQGPGAAFFSYRCGSSSIGFFMQGNPVFQVSFSEITGPLSLAISSGQNQPIVSNAEVALWALHSDELQIHQAKDPDLTRYVLPSTICGPLYINGNGATSAQALAIVQVTGTGQGIALAQVSSDGHVTAIAAISGTGTAFAAAQSSMSTGSTTPVSNTQKFHIVVKGENLFRIALRYGTTVSILAQINHLSDPTKIYVGQKIYLP